MRLMNLIGCSKTGQNLRVPACLRSSGESYVIKFADRDKLSNLQIPGNEVITDLDHKVAARHRIVMTHT